MFKKFFTAKATPVVVTEDVNLNDPNLSVEEFMSALRKINGRDQNRSA